ncbi:CARDB domain-containing protein [Vibrio spartinae]|uniref:CARDB family protein n=1 Tax=Vibrio spartinae TaxID=1918945 RepID=A0A1N6M3M2_9VIBR|nr:CARDB domain-containing protein [Vibrio spartinae]QMV14554.1 CARDB family protein [Vibrio spartinae]SIO94044.1 hypothetical protein VSP9026_01725 [Vibrio spartinae]
MKLTPIFVALIASVGLSSQSALASTQEHAAVDNAPTTASCNAPDWLIASGSLSPGTVVAGGKVSVETTVATGCPQTSGTAPTLGVLLADANGQPLGLFGEIPIALPSGARYSFTLNIPKSLPAGNYMIVLSADYRQVVKETNESNNVAAARLTVVSSAAEVAEAQAEQSSQLSTSGPVNYIDRSTMSSDIFMGAGVPEIKGMTVVEENTKVVDDLLKRYSVK